MNDADKAAIRARLAAATQGAWEHEQNDWQSVVRIASSRPRKLIAYVGGSSALGHNGYNDAELIAHAPADLAALLASLEEAERERDELRALLAECRQLVEADEWRTPEHNAAWLARIDAALGGGR